MNYQQIMEAFKDYVITERPRVESPQSVEALMRPLLANKTQEEFHILCLNTRNQVLSDETMVTVGLVDRAQIHPREVYRRAILANAARIICVHNHPTGDATPSPSDITATRELRAAGKIMGIELTDHVIIGEGYVSMRAEGLLDEHLS